MPNLFESIFSDEMRRNPYPAYAQLRERPPVLHDPQSGLWLIFDYESVKRALNDQEAFSSRHGPDWLIFSDPPRHSKLRALVSQAFTPLAEVDGERLTQVEILGFFQLLLLAGSETTTNLINNAIICFVDHPDQLARLRSAPGLLLSAIEEVLRYRSPLQWMYRKTIRDIELHGQVIPAGKLVLAMAGFGVHPLGCPGVSYTMSCGHQRQKPPK